MPIRRRITKFKKLTYHREFGSLENAPVRDNGTSYPFPALAPGTQVVGLIVTDHNYGFGKKLKLNVANVIVGLVRNHDNQRNGIGPGQGFSGWVAKDIIVEESTGLAARRFYRLDPKTGKRTELTQKDLLDCWKYSGRAEPKRKLEFDDHDHVFRSPSEMMTYEEALDAIYLDYEDIHNVAFPWKRMRYRKARVTE